MIPWTNKAGDVLEDVAPVEAATPDRWIMFNDLMTCP